jgi:hypothetical protein
VSKAVLGAALIGAVIVAEVATAMFDPALTVNPLFQKAMFAIAMEGVSMEAGAIASALTSNRGQNVTTRQPASARQIIYGQQRIGGVIIYKSTTGGSHDQLNYVIVLAGHEVDSIVNLYLDGRQVHWAGGVGNVTRNGVNFGGNADGNSHTGPNGVQYNFGGLVYCHAEFGDQTAGTVDQGLTANDPLWAPDGQGGSPWVGGCTYIYLKVENSSGTFPTEPEIRVTVNGKNNIWDPRSQSYKFTNNWALIAADIITDAQFGLGDNTVDQLQLIAAANVCDEQVTLASGQTEARYTCNFHYDTSTTPGDALSNIMSGAAGMYSQIGGQHYLWPAYWSGPSFTFGLPQVTDTIQWKPVHSVPYLVNVVTGTFVAPTFPYNITGNLYDSNGFYNGQAQNNFSFAFQATNFPGYAQDTLHGYPSNQWLTADGGHQHPLEISLLSVLSMGQAQRIAKIMLMRNRFQGSGSIELNMSGYVMQEKDVFSMNISEMGWSGKTLEVLGSSLSVVEDEPSGAPLIKYSLNVNETDASIYTWSTIEELTIYDVPALPSQTPLVPAPPTNMQLFSGPNVTEINPDQTVNNLIVVEWDTPLDNKAIGININYRRSGTTNWIAAPAGFITMNTQWISNVVPGATYDVQISSYRANGTISTWVQQLGYTVSLTPTDLGTLAAQLPALSAGAALGGTTPGEMLLNSNFALSSTALTDWTTGAGTATVDTTQHKIGAQSAKVVGGFITQPVTLTAGHTYVYQGWVQAAGNTEVGSALGAALSIASSTITLQKATPASTTASGQTAALLAATAAGSWTFLQITFLCNTTGSYALNCTDNYGGTAGTGGGAWFSGVSLTDTTGAADVTGAQPIIYLPSTQSIVPNGNFPLGTLQGWILNPATGATATLGSDSFGQRAYMAGGVGAYMFSPSFSVVPGSKYRIVYTAYNGSNSGGIFFRIAWQKSATQPANVVPAGTGPTTVPGFNDFLGGGSVTTAPTAYNYDWVAPAGINYASLAVYAVGASDLAIQSVAVEPYVATGQYGADVTSTNTSNDTNNVDGVPSTTIASVVPSGFKLFINSGARTYSIQAI